MLSMGGCKRERERKKQRKKEREKQKERKRERARERERVRAPLCFSKSLEPCPLSSKPGGMLAAEMGRFRLAS